MGGNVRDISRRRFLKWFLAGTGAYAGMAALPFTPRLSAAFAEPALGLYHFPQGLASGDPQPDALMLWTRVEALSGADDPIDLYVQVSEQEDFSNVVIEQALRALPEADHTVRFFAQGLKPDTRYFYRFFAGPDAAPFIGRSRTAPEAGSKRPVRFAIASCQNYEQGYFSAWRHLVREDRRVPEEAQIDFVLHLGDFIYEVTGDVPMDRTPARLVPKLPDGSPPWVPDGTRTWWQPGAQAAVTLADYRHLYKVYLSDPDLQAARARFPFICTWDDHEFTNDAWQAHDTYFGEGEPAQRRKVAANRAWFEFIPAILSGGPGIGGVENAATDFADAPVEDAPFETYDDAYLFDGDNKTALETLTIYRAFSWGSLADLIVTDTRSYRSPPVVSGEVEALLEEAPLPPVGIVKTLDAGRTANNGAPPETITYKETSIPNPRRAAPPGTCLGAQQKAWFKEVMKQSGARWKIWANSIPALPLRLNLGSIPFAGLDTGYLGTDAWQGYPGELTELMAYLREEKIANVVSCAGDYHTHAAGRLPVDPDAEETEFAAVEFAVTSISSGNLYEGVEARSRDSESLRRLVVYETPEGPVENWNNSIVNGVLAGLAASVTGSPNVSGVFASKSANPGLNFLDSNSHGYGLVDLTEEEISVRLVNVGDVRRDEGPEGTELLRTTLLRVPAWKDGEEPPEFTPAIQGAPLFPFA